MTEEAVPYVVTPVAQAYVPPTEEKKAFLAALAAAQGEFLPIVRSQMARIRMKEEKGGGEYTFKYADLAEVIEKTRPALAKNGLSFRSRLLPHTEPGHVWLQSVLSHAEGHEDISEIAIAIAGDIKLFGGQLTYLRRYMGSLQLGIASEDDADNDGREGGDSSGTQNIGGRTAPAPRPRPQPAAKKAAAPAEPPAEPAAEEQPATDTADAIQPGQAKWIHGKLEAYYSPAEAQKWLEDRGIKVVEAIPAAHFESLKKELVAL